MNRYELLRFRLGLGIRAAADHAKVAERTIMRLEDGSLERPQAATAARLAAAYGVSVDVLLGLEPVPPAPAPPAAAEAGR